MVRVGAIGAEGGAHTVHAYPFALPRAALAYSTVASPQQLQLALEVPLFALQRLQLVLTLPVRFFKFLVKAERKGRAVMRLIMCTSDQSETRICCKARARMRVVDGCGDTIGGVAGSMVIDLCPASPETPKQVPSPAWSATCQLLHTLPLFTLVSLQHK